MSDLDDVTERASIELAAANIDNLSRCLNWAARVSGQAARHHYHAMSEPLATTTGEEILPVPDALMVALLANAAGASWNRVMHELGALP